MHTYTCLILFLTIQTSVDSFPQKGRSTSKLLPPGLGSASLRPKDLQLDSNPSLHVAEDQVVMVDSCFKKGISTNHVDRSLSRRQKGEVLTFDYSWDCVLNLHFSNICNHQLLLSMYKCDTVQMVTWYSLKMCDVDLFPRFSVTKCGPQLSAGSRFSGYMPLCITEWLCCWGKRWWADNHSSAEAAAWHGHCAAKAAHFGDS